VVTDAQGSPSSAIQVDTSYPALAFLLGVFKTRVAINGQRYELPWGTHTFPVGEGRHDVRVSFKYLLPSDAGGNEVEVDVQPGQTVRVRYRAPWLVFLKGKIQVEAGKSPSVPPVAAASGPGWNADPSGRHELRYWDGQGWTADVSDQGTTSTDTL
jgi:hypothetical protein